MMMRATLLYQCVLSVIWEELQQQVVAQLVPQSAQHLCGCTAEGS